MARGIVCLLANFVLLLAASRAASAQPAVPETAVIREDLPKYREVEVNFGTGGQPTEAGIRLLARKGYGAVINLRSPGEQGSLGAEETLVTGLGMKYFNIPVGRVPEDRQAREFLGLVEELGDERVFVHCATANRVGSFVLLERVLRHDWPVEKAAEEAARVGLRSETLRDFAVEFIKRYRSR